MRRRFHGSLVEVNGAGFRCEGCGITVFGDPKLSPKYLCTSCISYDAQGIPTPLKPIPAQGVTEPQQKDQRA